MKITFVLPTVNLSGGIRVVAIYARLLQQRGHKVFVVSVAHEQPSLTEQFRSLLKGQGWIDIPKHLPSHFDNLDVPHKIIPQGHQLADEDVPDADVVVATFWYTAEWVAKLSPQKGAKAYFVQGHEVFGGAGAATYQLPLHKIVISQFLLKLMRDKYGDPNLSFVPNSVDLQQFNAPIRSKQKVPTVGMLYSTEIERGCDINLRAIALVQKEIPKLRLVAFGVSKPSSELPLPPNSKYVRQPSQDTIKNIYAQCDAWLFGSREEGFGLPILEAMACRTPVIAVPGGAAPELLADGNGILVEPDNPLDMAKAIKHVCQLSNSEWQSMSERAYSKAGSYSWQDATSLFEVALQRAIEKQQPSSLSTASAIACK
ncbi:glycosyltransferase family 4 protein [Myxosarcina sp. GI1]|uniref:glycosyltransferase family 4 protein n=1 Tax=Myxosarcina sp. GI1 TaxID=1541065 RepID=UPI00056A832F|nr:glycosyltransferase family 4 protein [Myxosarcina sp. GI1]